MDYIVYNVYGLMLHRFACEAAGERYLRDHVKRWSDVGQRAPELRLCYNGSKSVEVARSTETRFLPVVKTHNEQATQGFTFDGETSSEYPEN